MGWGKRRGGLRGATHVCVADVAARDVDEFVSREDVLCLGLMCVCVCVCVWVEGRKAGE